MTTEQVVGYLLEGEGLDFLRELLAWVCQLMEAEVSGLIGAARGERAPDERLTQRNSYRARRGRPGGRARVGDPKLRRGSNAPDPQRRDRAAVRSDEGDDMKPGETLEAASAAMQADVARARLNLRNVGNLRSTTRPQPGN